MFPVTNLLLILSSPSGAGKTTLSQQLLVHDSQIKLSVSATTRPKRQGEVDGKDYLFLSEEKFQQDMKEGEFLETARIFDAFYGTPKKPVNALLEQGMDVLFDVNWQGADAITEACPGRCVRVFILPPSLEVLEERLRARALDAPEVIEKRLLEAEKEIARWPTYDYIIINDDLNEALGDLTAIVRAERLKAQRFHAHA